MRLSMLLVFLFCISFGFAALGNNFLGTDFTQSYQSLTNTTIYDSSGNVIDTNGLNLGGQSFMTTMFNFFTTTLITAGLFGLAASIVTGSFSVMFTIPAAIVLNLVAYFMTPINYMLSIGLPEPFKTFLFAIFGLMIFAGVIAFVRGDF